MDRWLVILDMGSGLPVGYYILIFREARGRECAVRIAAQESPPSGQGGDVRELAESSSPGLVYFSSVSENTRRFVERLEIDTDRIPLRPRVEGQLRVAQPFVLVLPTYGGGEHNRAVPKQVGGFLNDPANRALLRGVITAGNTNFGEHYCLAGRVISAKCGVPELYRFELLGTQRDVTRVREGLGQFWEQHDITTQMKEYL